VIPSPNNIHWHIKAKNSEAIDAIETTAKDKLLPWHDSLVNNVALFSQYLLKHPQSKQQAELVALAYWCRKANLAKIKQEYKLLESSSSNTNKRQSVARVFHIAPSNVDTVFFYSLLLSALSGNENIVRISGRSGELCYLLIDLFKQFLNENKALTLKGLVNIVEYNAINTAATTAFSQWATLRVIWGGDEAIEAILAIAPHDNQLCFPDRYSIAVCHLTEEDDIQTVVKKFIADFSPFNQQACSSPKALFWLNTCREIQSEFFKILNQELTKIELDSNCSNRVERQINFQQLLLINDNKIIFQQSNDYLMLVEFESLCVEHLIRHQGNSLLLQKNIVCLTSLPISKKLQSITYWGLNENEQQQIKHTSKQVVPFGLALAFNHHWDGKALLEEFTLPSYFLSE